MSKTSIVKSGERFFIKQLSKNEPIKLDRVIFANVNGINGDTEINVNSLMPDASKIVHTAPVTQSGLLNDNTVVYSVILDTSVGDFSFNYIGLVNSETNTLCMVMHTDLTRKIKTAGQRQGNTITESIWLEIDNASESTGITVNAETWQIDYSKRLAGEDERIRLTNYDLYNRLTIHHGLTITKNNNKLTVSEGLVYVAGLRVEHTEQTAIKVENNQSLYIDAWMTGTTTGEWSVNYNLIAGVNLKDYEKNGFKHYVERIASIDAAGNLKIVKSSAFVTTLDLATNKSAGIVKLSSEINSKSESEAATPLAVKKVNDQIETKFSKTGGEIKGNVAISGDVEIKNASTGIGNTLKTNPNGSFILSHNDGVKNEQKLAFNSVDNTFYFTNLKNVAVNGRPVLSLGDGGISAVGAAFTNNNFDAVAVDGCGFYNLGENSNGTFPTNFSKLCSIINISRSFSDNKKCSQIIVDTINNKIAFRTASNSDFKPWVELLTSENINNYQNGIGVNQKWQDVSDSRIIETVYTNTTSKPIFINIVVDVTNSNYKKCSLLVDNVAVSQMITSNYSYIGNARSIALSAIIPAGSTYMLTADSFNPRLYLWSELR